MQKRTALILVVVLAIALTCVQSWLALSVPGMSNDEAYLYQRQVESIRHTGVPLTQDWLSPTDKRLLVTPFYEYVLWLFSTVMPLTVALKVVPAIFSGALVILVFVLAYRLTQDGLAASMAAMALAFMPGLFGLSLNTASPATLILTLTAILIWQLMMIEGKKELGVYAVLIVLLSFTHPSVVLVLIGLLFYAGLLLIEELKMDKGFSEVLLFSTLFIVWSLTVRFKDALITHGPAVVFQNIPPALRGSYFAQLGMLDVVGLVGIVPFLFGGYMVYTYIFRERQRDVYLLLGFALAMGMLLWLEIVRPLIGITFLGLVLCVLFGVWVKRLSDYVRLTRRPAWRIPLLFVLALLLAASSLLPATRIAQAVLAAAPSQQELDELVSLSTSLPPGAVILAMPEEGYRVEALAERKVVQDLDFILQKDAVQRYADVQRMFTTPSKVDAVGLLNKYHVTDIYVSRSTRANRGRPPYADDACFPVFADGVSLTLRSQCKVEQR